MQVETQKDCQSFPTKVKLKRSVSLVVKSSPKEKSSPSWQQVTEIVEDSLVYFPFFFQIQVCTF
jgi:hypothetical protein